MLQVLPPRPVSPVGRPVRPTLDEFGHPLSPTPRRLSKLNILRRVRPVLLAVRAARATYFATALVQYEQTLRRAADPFAAQAARLKLCAEHLLSLKSPLSIITVGQTPDQVGQRSELPSGQRYYFPLGWPVGEISKLLAEIQLFDKLHREFEANILAQPLEIHAPPATTEPFDTPIKGTPAAAPPLIWDEFLPHFRQAVRLIKKDIFTEADCERLTQLGQHLVKELDDSIKKRPTATKLRLTEALRECLNEMSNAETMLSYKLAQLEKTPTLYDARYPLIREAIAAAEDTLGDLIGLLGKYYPETLAGNIRTTKGLLAMRELVLEYLPGSHDLNKRVRYEQAAPAAPATTAPPARDTPKPIVAAYPWAEIEALAVRIGLRKAGRFTPAGNLVASAVAGLIDALREAEMLPAAATLPILYAAFKHHYKCSVGVDRITATRAKWQRTARKELGLD